MSNFTLKALPTPETLPNDPLTELLRLGPRGLIAKAVEAELLAFYDFPAEHWLHIRTTNPIESTFATVRLRTKKHVTVVPEIKHWL